MSKYYICSEFTYDRTQPLGLRVTELKRFVKRAKCREDCQDANHCVIVDYEFDTREEAESDLDLLNLLHPMIT